jgi:hypothetical protein
MDGRLLSALTRIFVTSVRAWYASALGARGVRAKTGAVDASRR